MFSTTWRKFRTASYPIVLTDHKLLITIILLTASITFNVYVLIAVLRQAYSPICSDRKQIPDPPLRTAVGSNASTRTRLQVWPEELPVGDRIANQLAFVPDGYDHDSAAPDKLILVHTGPGNPEDALEPGRTEFVGCPVSRCAITFDEPYGPEVDAVLFRHCFSRPAFKRPPNQIWIMYHTDCPLATVRVDYADRDVFNWTANYRWDSDIPHPFGYYLGHTPFPKYIHVDPNHSGNKSKTVAMFIPNCRNTSDDCDADPRWAYIDELAKYIAIDTYGPCGEHKCPNSDDCSSCIEALARDYKFYLAFEKVDCHYYITEDFVDALKHGMVPIVMGPSRIDYETVAPHESFMHVDDFASPKELAEYLFGLDKYPVIYEKYFAWKENGTFVTDTRFYCRLCAMLHDEQRPRKHYDDFNDWWSGTDVCSV